MITAKQRVTVLEQKIKAKEAALKEGGITED
jgi:hypothetical protein